MAKIYLSYSHRDAEFARQVTERLRTGGHEIILDVDALAPGQSWRTILAEGLQSADAFIVLLSENSLASQFTLMEVGTARAYSAQTGKPLVIPIIIDDIPIPIPLQDIHILLAKDRDIERIFVEITRALSALEAQNIAKEKAAKDISEKIEANSSSYI
jgi:hypothetical protein